VFWQTGLGQLLLGFGSNLLFVVVLTAIGLLYVRAELGRRSRPLRRLLGIGGHPSNTVRIVVSSIYVVPQGALGVLSKKKTGFYGPVMNQSEYVSAQLLRDAIRTRPAARPLRALLDQLGLLETVHDPIDCDIVFSPQYVDGKDGKAVTEVEYEPYDLSGNGPVVERIQESLREPGVYILVGGPTYNAVVAYLMTRIPEDQAWFSFTTSAQGEPQIVAEKGRRGQQAYPQEWRSINAERVLVDHFILQKITGYGPAKATVFVCAGLSSLGTAVAVSLLASRWRQLENHFGAGGFAQVYRFDNRRDVAMPAADDVDKAMQSVTAPIWQPRLAD
jgi:hypothetical protein